MPCVVSFTRNWRAAFTLVGGSETTSGNIESPRRKNNCFTCLQAWPPPPSCAESHLDIGHAWHAPPYFTSPGLP